MNDEWSEAVDSRTQAADRLLDAARSGKPCPPVRDLIGTERDAYAVQEINRRRALDEGRRPVGWKIGLTNAENRRRFGADEPSFGTLFADRSQLDGLPAPMDGFLQPRAEAEIALVLGRDLEGGPFTAAEVIRAVEFALPAIEIADSRVAAWDITPVDTIADNASSGAFVLGNTPVPLAGLDLRQAAMTMTRGDAPQQEVSTGSGAACLGHPVNALVWLAGRLGRTDRPLRAGEVVLTGALGPVAPVEPGDVFEARIAGLGSVRAVFAP
ncbi:2-keto-4-pentenoate hydratase [Nonomuraea cavernae]|uniref:2-keto-4-pentenoate hydratase n=1 Tax=Nonomuraea cavernae TaxID=2045107 RepID=A0A917YRH5_9ACTN|nr:fumarylacetoacetate hydrolase family protein [Nonomuraea cavernae]MCA2183826.1 fumarylacetoacetate hydrolase family protein [Nonomuraea cavernae]GGO61480.1 2-keto-4-pentenoate hydratase [Nonomuraea cavernae]